MARMAHASSAGGCVCFGGSINAIELESCDGLTTGRRTESEAGFASHRPATATGGRERVDGSAAWTDGGERAPGPGAFAETQSARAGERWRVIARGRATAASQRRSRARGKSSAGRRNLLWGSEREVSRDGGCSTGQLALTTATPSTAVDYGRTSRRLGIRSGIVSIGAMNECQPGVIQLI